MSEPDANPLSDTSDFAYSLAQREAFWLGESMTSKDYERLADEIEVTSA